MSVHYPLEVKSYLLGFVTIASLCMASAGAADEPGIWQQHEVRFNYLGFTATYSCQGLQYTLTTLLKESGARPDVAVVPGPCARGYTVPERIIYADLKFSTLAPSDTAGTASSAEGTRASGAWRHVTIAARSVQQQGGNCELVQEFDNKVLPLFTTRNVKANFPCVPFKGAVYSFSLSFYVFAPSNASLPNSAVRPNAP